MSRAPLEAYYGLPSEVVHCTKCVMTNQKPHSVNETTHRPGSAKATMGFDEHGVCDACRYNEEKHHAIDWAAREEQLLRLLDKYRRTDGGYEVIVAGSGGKDSCMTSHLLKAKYGMKVLTVTFSPMLYTDVGWRNMQGWIHKGGFDNYLFTPNGEVMRTLAREAFDNLYFPLQPFKFGIRFFAPRMAVKFDVPLVMYGEPYLEYGSHPMRTAQGPTYELHHYVNDSKDLYLGGRSIEELKARHGLSDADFQPYLPLRSDEVRGKKVVVEFLGWYVKWDPQQAYYYAAEHCGFEPDEERSEGTYGRYANVDEKFEPLHYFTHFIKFGIGRCRFDASQEIRNGHITREEAIALMKRFEGEPPKRYQKECLEFLGLSDDEFRARTDAARSPHLWKQEDGIWKLRHPVEDLADDPASRGGENLRYDYL